MYARNLSQIFPEISQPRFIKIDTMIFFFILRLTSHPIIELTFFIEVELLSVKFYTRISFSFFQIVDVESFHFFKNFDVRRFFNNFSYHVFDKSKICIYVHRCEE